MNVIGVVFTYNRRCGVESKLTYDASEVAADLIMRHARNMDSVMIQDITMLVEEVYCDGDCRGHNDALQTEEKPRDTLEWWSDMDKDEDYIKSVEFSKEVKEQLESEFWDDLSEDEVNQLFIYLDQLEKATKKKPNE